MKIFLVELRSNNYSVINADAVYVASSLEKAESFIRENKLDIVDGEPGPCYMVVCEAEVDGEYPLSIRMVKRYDI